VAATLDHTQLEEAWVLAGGPQQYADTAAAIAQAESSGDPTKINNTARPNRPGYHAPSSGAQPEYSVGLWQINLEAHPGYTEAQMLDPVANAEAAVAISSAGSSFAAWTTYTNGVYRSYLAGSTSSGLGGTTGGGGAGAAAASDATRSTSGWHSINTALSRRLPGSLHDAQRLRKAALHKLHR
jgi:Lysozyme like domain